jgi:hypothetical protein
MHNTKSSRLFLVLTAVAILAALNFASTHLLPAQHPQPTFGGFFAPYVGKEVYREGSSATLLEVGLDYLVSQYRNEQKEAIPFHSIRSVQFQEKLDILLNH